MLVKSKTTYNSLDMDNEIAPSPPSESQSPKSNSFRTSVVVIVSLAFVLVAYLINQNLSKDSSNEQDNQAKTQQTDFSAWTTSLNDKYTFSLPSHIRQNESTQAYESTEYSSLKFTVVLDKAGYGIDCSVKTRSSVIPSLGKEVQFDIYKGQKPEGEYCISDKSDIHTYVAILEGTESDPVDVAVLELSQKEFSEGDGEKLFKDILSTFQVRS